MKHKRQAIWRIILSLMLMVTWFILPANVAVVKATTDWSVPMTAVTASDGGNPNLVFGTKAGATDGFEFGIDWDHAPPPGTPKFDAYFQIADPDHAALDEDYRAPAAIIQWTLYTFSTTQSINLTWDTSAVPADVLLRMSEAGKPDIDMKATNNTILPAGTHTLTIEALTITPPTVITLPAPTDNITIDSAVLAGNLTALGSFSSANVSFMFGNAADNLTLIPVPPKPMTGVGVFGIPVINLNSNTTYYFRAWAIGTQPIYPGIQPVVGDILSVTTLKLPPVVSTQNATGITSNSATISGNLTSLGDHASADLFFRWGTVPGNLANEIAATPPWLMAPGGFSTSLSSLTPNTTYYFKAKATIAGVTVYGAELSFTTLRALISIDVTPDNPFIKVGQTLQFSAIGTFSAPPTENVTASANWTSSNTTVASIGQNTGLAQGLADGTTLIIASLEGKSDNTTLTVDGTPPEVILYSPNGGQRWAGGSSQSITWTATDANMAANPIGILYYNGTSWVQIGFNEANDGSYQWTVPLLNINNARVRVTAVDRAYNSGYDESDADFTIDSTPPTIISNSPANGATDVDVGTTIQFTFSEPMVWSSVQSAFSISPTVSGSLSYVGTTKTFTPVAPLAYSTTYTVTVSTDATDSAGNHLDGDKDGTSEGSPTDDYRWTFTTMKALVSIDISPDNPTIAKGRTQRFSAIGTYSDGDTANLTTTATWTSSNTTVASIVSAGLVQSLAEGTTNITATQAGISANTTLTVGPKVLDVIKVTPENPTIIKGETLPFTANGTYSDNSWADITSSVTWISSNTTVATIDTNGLAQSLAKGTTVITAEIINRLGQTISDNTTLAVKALETIAVAPENPLIPLGKTQPFTANGTYSDNSWADLTDEVTWTSSNPAKATIDANTGLATTEAVGSTIITASLGEISGSTKLTITSAGLESIVVTPVNPTIALGQSKQFSANGTYSDSSWANLTTIVTWTSSNNTAATIDTNGLAQSLAEGQTTITATLGTVSGNTTLTVGPTQFDYLEITPDNPSIAAGNWIQFKATEHYTYGPPIDVTGNTNWSSDNTSVANFVTNSGNATALAEGTATISAIYGGHTDTTTLTVTAPVLKSIAIDQETPTVAAGKTLQLTVTGTYSDSSNLPITNIVTWASLDRTVATISTTGNVTGVATGNATIRATHGGFRSEVTLRVTPAILNSITVTPAAATIAAGYTIQFTATGAYSDNSTADITTSANWTSSDNTTATITAGGLASSLSAGTTTITATLGTVSGNTTLTVTGATLQSIAVTADNLSIAAGRTQPFSAIGTYSDTTSNNITNLVTWASSDTSKATIAAGGLATALAQGTANITATLGTIKGSTTLTVTAAVLDAITVTPANPSIPAGRTKQFSATGIYSNKSTANLTASANWTSSNNTKATITAGGLATGLAQGTATITATWGNVSGNTTLTVTAPVLVTITVTADNLSIAAGKKQPFSAIGTYSDNSTANITSTVKWSSSNTGIASIDATGLATGHNPGVNITITATRSGVSGTTTLTVTQAVLNSISVTPLNPTIFIGRNQPFRATGIRSDGSKVDITSTANWTSSDNTTATIAAGGLATGLAQGIATITATWGSVSGNTTLTVTAAPLSSIAVTADNLSIAAGKTQQFTATGNFSGTLADLTNLVTWSSSNTRVTRINTAGGLAASYAPGTANITATLGNISGSIALTVGPAILESITLTPVDSTITFVSGKPPTVQFRATAIYSDGATVIVTGMANWTSSDESVATIESTGDANPGRATTANPGNTPRTTTIGATYGDRSDNTTLTVRPDTVPPVVTLTSPTEGLILREKTLTVAGYVDNVATTANVSAIVNGKIITLTLDGKGNFSKGVILKPGSNTVLVTAVDASGNTGTSDTITVKVDPRKPKISITSPAGGTLTNKNKLTVTGVITGAGLKATVVFNGKSQEVDVIGGGFSANLTLVEGVNIIVANAYAAGHDSLAVDPKYPDQNYLGTSGVVAVNLDTIAPMVTIDSPVSGSIVSTPGIEVSGTINDPAIDTAQLILNQGAPQTIRVVSGIFKQQITLVPLVSANNTIAVVATDKAGNISPADPVTIELDNTKPRVTITAPANNLLTNIAGQTVNGTVSDPSITEATIVINGVPLSQQIAVAPDGSFSTMVTLKTGPNTIEVKAWDNATPPNMGTSGEVNVTVDNIAPVIIIGLSTPAESITITVTSNETLLIAPTVTVDSANIIMTPVGVNKWSGIYGSEAQPIAAGEYTVTATGTDEAGNTATATATFSKGTIYVDGIVPTPVTTPTTTLQVATNGAVSANISVAQHIDNPSGNVGNPEEATEAAGVFVEINASTELHDNLKQIYIQVNYDVDEIEALGIDESKLKLYLWDVTLGIWQVVPDSSVNTTAHYIYGTVDHLSKYGSFGAPKPKEKAGIEQEGALIEEGEGVAPGIAAPVSVSGLSATPILRVDSRGIVRETSQLKSLDEKASLDIAKGTRLLTAQGNALTSLSATIVTSPPAPPSERAIVLTYDLRPDGAIFEPAITLTMSYDPASLPDGTTEDELYIAYWDGSQWLALESTVDTEANTISAQISHFTQFAVISQLPPVLVPPPPPTPALPTPTLAPASFAISNISISPTEIEPAKQVTISAMVTNTGGREGSYTVILKVNGVAETSQEVTLGAGESKTVSFTIAKDAEGSYTVSIDDQVSQFTVTTPPPLIPKPVAELPVQPPTNWALIGGIIAGVVIIIGVVIWLTVFRRRTRQA